MHGTVLPILDEINNTGIYAGDMDIFEYWFLVLMP